MECEFCEEEFESENALHLHWSEEHSSEINSHQKEKVEKAEKARNKRQEERKQKIKTYSLMGLSALAVIAAGFAILPGILGGESGQELDLESQPMLGEENASVTIVEFGDYRCPYCAQFEDRVFPKIKSNYIDTGQAKFYFMNYAFLGEGSTRAAKAAECVYKQSEEQFWNFHKATYQAQGSEAEQWATQQRLMQIANSSTENVDLNQLETCIENSETADEVRQDIKAARRMSVSSTPTVFVNGEKLSGWTYPQIKAAVDRSLNS